MKLFFYSPNRIEPWDYRNVYDIGIGGSETSHVELARRFARRGYDVTSYTDLPTDCPDREFGGVHWRDLDEADFEQEGLWVIYRNLSCVDNFTPIPYKRRAWLICQDVDYHDWTEERARKFDLILGLCSTHVAYLKQRHPEVEERIHLSGNGISTDVIMGLDAQPRNPKRLIYSSSPDRGLGYLLRVFERAREEVPDLELHVFYGLDNIKKLTKNASDRAYWGPTYKTVERAQQTPGVIWHGRVGQQQLAQEYLKSGIWCYPTDFTETSCITCMEAQAYGAIPITRPHWGLLDNVKGGVFIEGTPADNLVLARYVDSVVRIALNPERQQRLRCELVADTLRRHNWERIIDGLEACILHTFRREDFPEVPGTVSQMAFQHRYSFGRVLNIGCNDDNGGFKRRGATNVDICTVDLVTGREIPCDVIADARDLPASLYGSYDSAILGDILEHMTDEDAIRSLRSAWACLRSGGKIIITVPCDERNGEPNNRPTNFYATGVMNYHSRPITAEIVHNWVTQAGLRVELTQSIDSLPYFMGWGVIASG